MDIRSQGSSSITTRATRGKTAARPLFEITMRPLPSPAGHQGAPNHSNDEAFLSSAHRALAGQAPAGASDRRVVRDHKVSNHIEILGIFHSALAFSIFWRFAARGLRLYRQKRIQAALEIPKNRRSLPPICFDKSIISRAISAGSWARQLACQRKSQRSRCSSRN